MKKKSNFTTLLIIMLFILFGGAGGFIYISPMFEKENPVIKFEDNIYWNLKDKLKLNISDASGVKYYRVTFNDGNKDIVLKNEVLEIAQKEVSIDLDAPQLDMFFKSTKVKIIIEAVDSSKWNFLEGNKVVKSYSVNIDKQRPESFVVSNSLAIRKGGSALVVVSVKDENLKDAYISFNEEERFEIIPFYKENYYIALIAWPVNIDTFKGVNLIAIDKANNKSTTKVPLYIRDMKVKNSNIKLPDSFIKNVSVKVIERSSKEVPSDLADIFVKQNREIRNENINTIKEISRKYMDKELIKEFKIEPFKRLTNSATAGHFGQRRHYYLNDEKIDEAWHLGMDWASVKRADIFTTNKGTVIFNDYLGIYGNSVILDHTLGLQTLYAHTSSSSVNLADQIRAKEKIANTGITGAVLGDHLHFGVLVQGIEVNPLEWMDKNWIKSRVTDIIKEAKEAIDSK